MFMATATADQPQSQADYLYWAFISYSQRDVRWARWLQHKLETYRVPRGLQGADADLLPVRLFPIFRDRDELPSAPDLGAKIQEALRRSRTLIVLCSPHAARSPWVNKEVAEFKALGRSDRIFPLIIDGEPWASDRPESGLEECFPPAVRFAVTSDGHVTDRRVEPIAADARRGKDGRDLAALKVIAGILNVRFDALRMRDLRRQRRRRAMQWAVASGSVLAASLLYLGLADADANLPGGELLRRSIDSQRLSVFRPVASESTIAEQRQRVCDGLRQQLLQRMREDQTAWGTGQVLSGLYGDPEATSEQLEPAAQTLKEYFEDRLITDERGAVGWNDGFTPARAEGPIWMLMALSAALGRRDGVTQQQRVDFERYLARTQEIADRFSSVEEGSWNVVIEETQDHRYVYSTALAVHAMLDLKAVNLGWHGDTNIRDERIRRSVEWLMGPAFRGDRAIVGWGRVVNDDKPANPMLGLLVLSALGRAHNEAQCQLPQQIVQHALVELTDLRHRTYHPTDEDILHQVDGRLVTVPTRVMWFPWSVAALDAWLEYGRRNQLPASTLEGLRRSRSHLLVQLSLQMEEEARTSMIFVAAENAYALHYFNRCLKAE